MDILGGFLAILGLFMFLAASTFIIIKAFKTSLWWGFGSLFIPVVELVFIVKYWDETKKFVLWIVIGVLIFVIGGSIYNFR